jgi:hypothetical protein
MVDILLGSSLLSQNNWECGLQGKLLEMKFYIALSDFFLKKREVVNKLDDAFNCQQQSNESKKSALNQSVNKVYKRSGNVMAKGSVNTKTKTMFCAMMPKLPFTSLQTKNPSAD